MGGSCWVAAVEWKRLVDGGGWPGRKCQRRATSGCRERLGLGLGSVQLVESFKLVVN